MPRPRKAGDELLRNAARTAGRYFYAAVAGAARYDDLTVAQNLVLEPERGFTEVREGRSQDQGVVEAGGALVEGVCLDHDEAVAGPLHVPVRETGGAEPLHAADLEVGEVVGVVDDALRVGLAVPDAQPNLVDRGSFAVQLPLN